MVKMMGKDDGSFTTSSCVHAKRPRGCIRLTHLETTMLMMLRMHACMVQDKQGHLVGCTIWLMGKMIAVSPYQVACMLVAKGVYQVVSSVHNHVDDVAPMGPFHHIKLHACLQPMGCIRLTHLNDNVNGV